MDGILIINKEQNYTSHDVVAKLRGIIHQKKIGHTGTLDPMATGVLPVCLGNATKLCDMLTDKSKEYIAEMILGISTTTQDISGEVLEEKNVDCSNEDIISAVQSFVGEYEQLPPMYSAIKVNGRKLYELAREGKVVERKTRRVCIDEIEILEIKGEKVRMRVACSKGTYIRTLCDDIGRKLGCNAAMGSLERTRVGSFKLEDSYTLSEVENMMCFENLENHILSTDSVFADYDKITVVSENVNKYLLNGNPLKMDNFERKGVDGELVRVYNASGKFAGVFRCDVSRGLYIPYKMFLNNG